MTCGYCGEEFSPAPRNAHAAKWCSPKCRGAAWKRHHRRPGLAEGGERPCLHCPRRAEARGLCRLHYFRWRDHGDALWEPPKLSVAERLWSMLERGEPDACWPWRGSLDRKGYGQINGGVDGRGRPKRAHRVAYEAIVGQIPAEMELDHLCHTRDLTCPGGLACEHRKCCNPEHLEPVTGPENSRRGNERRRLASA